MVQLVAHDSDLACNMSHLFDLLLFFALEEMENSYLSTGHPNQLLLPLLLAVASRSLGGKASQPIGYGLP